MQKQSSFHPRPGRDAKHLISSRRSPAASSLRPKATALAVLGYIALIPALAHANCTTIGSATTCDTTSPSPWTTTIGTGPTSASGSQVTVGPNARIVVGDSSAIALSDNANIVVQSGALVQNSAVSSSGTYWTGANTIDFRNNSTLTVEQGATVLSNGTEADAEAVNPEGTGNTIVNNGTIRAANASALWFQNTSGSNTVINNATGVIQAANIMGSAGTGAVVFTNFGSVIGNMIFGDGNDTLNLETGSSESGAMEGGGGSNLLTLGGTGTATLPTTTIIGFQTLQKLDSGTWTVSSPIGGMGVTSAEVKQGTLVLTGNNASYTGTMLVDQTGTLRASAQSLTPVVTDNGLVQFQQDTAGTYSGLIQGSGAVEKDGAGPLMLAPTAAGGNTYTGGTVLKQGALWVSADNALGAASGGLTFDGGTLQIGQSFDLAGTRAISVTSNGGTIDTQDFQSTINQAITGSGALDKTGSGTLTVNGAIVGSIAADVQEGTLVLNGDASQFTGSVTVDQPAVLQASAQSLPAAVTDNGLVQFEQNTDGTYAGAIGGTGTVEKDGSGTLVLNGASSYSGGTSVAAGTLVVGDASHAGASIAGPATVAAGTTLGGYGSVGGDVMNNGTIAVANALSSAAAGVQPQPQGSFTIHGQLINAGLAQLGGSRSSPVGNTLNVGSYVGKNGTIALNTVLGGDNSPSDKVVIDGGTATGSTTLKVTNVGGTGAPTVSNGIEVVQAANGATTAAGAFTLAGGMLKAGAYEYYLARGGVTAGTSQDWYLRNTVAAGSGTSGATIGASGAAAGAAASAAGGAGTVVSQAATGNPVTLYRPEVALYAQIPAVMRELDGMQLDEFHLRQGDQMLLNETGPLPAGWGRVWGAHSVLSEGGDVSPQFDGTMGGAQVGQDLYADGVQGGQRNHYGFYLGMGRATGDVDGSAVGVAGAGVGHLSVNEYSLAGYWTHIGPSGWYTDTVLSGSALSADTTSTDNVHASTHGTAFTASIEAGMPFAIGHGLTMEPEAQVVYRHLSIDNLNDGISNVGFDSGNSMLARFGLRFAGTWDAHGIAWQPYMAVNVLHAFANGDHQTYDSATSVATPVNQTTGRIDAGLVTKFSKHGSVFATVSWGTNLGGEHVRTVGGNAGVRWSW
ncbi:autotransporter outer membrane beta-barrel domain-containing protein [Trinickia dinghuensis]|uniref:Autotransporter outer membrane beta-barrel domain-containing protein n=1 Tax=Trinickia dinghuensis TaxID=2291023 RepID=A0A3D8K367_9BURK|nr:autotransporter outer membrane beta-barrel domain-containing protein [Trinickia dinghuensis]RDU99679.1 autotransporter outer membrane beta-barrel domain-containing protein [Trinickia dinghuensis]